MSNNNENIILQVEGMDCSNCALGITKSLQKVGMQNVHVDFATGEACFTTSDKNNLLTAVNSIQELGYKVVHTKFGEQSISGFSRIEKRFLFTLPFTLVLFFAHMILPMHHVLNIPLIQLVLCIPVFAIGVMQFGKSAWGSIKSGVPNMDVLIFIGSSAAFVYSLLGMIWFQSIHLQHQYLFFETAATIITLVLLGNVLEHRSIKQTTSALRDLTAIQSTKAKVISLQFGKEIMEEIDIKKIHVGALVQVNEGDVIPVDGTVISGNASVDESMLTGESDTIEKQEGSNLIGGTILKSGNLRMRVEVIGDNTVLAKIIEMVKKAQQNKPSIQKLGDKIAAVFVPVVVAIAIITFLVNYFWILKGTPDVGLQAILRSIAVLVISCPCAMGLATPTAVMVGIGRAAKKGILIKGGNTLESMATIKKIVFDKTGTLTTGEFKIQKITCFKDISEPEVLSILYSVELKSSHPIAKSVVKSLNGKVQEINFISLREEKGVGVFAQDINQNTYAVGSSTLLGERQEQTNHSIYILKNNELIATIDLHDELKWNAFETIAYFKKQNITPILLSGDTAQKCRIVADELKIDEVYSRQMPEQKLKRIEQLSIENGTAMVGDGINDAPALAKAGVSISMGNASDIAKQSSQIVILKNNDLLLLKETHLISKHTLLTIKQNLFWAFFYNAVAIPIAAVGLLNPMVAALSMAFSDVIVIGNSIRLKHKKLS
jgi:P-type Cu+ transporter